MGFVHYTTLAGIRILENEKPIEHKSRLTVLGRPFLLEKRSQVVCECECGAIVVKQVKYLRSGHTQSCGCWKPKQTSERFTTHGASKTATYRCYHEMLRRCLSVGRKSYKDYGGRGITVCERWTESFDAFLDDMGERPTDGHSIERRNVDGDYCPENCHWATRIEQNNNTRSNVRIELDGETRTVAEWSRVSAIPANSIHHRLYRGWDARRAIWQPLRQRD